MVIYEFVLKNERLIIILLYVWNFLEVYFILKYFMYYIYISICNYNLLCKILYMLCMLYSYLMVVGGIVFIEFEIRIIVNKF